ncbi:MAG: phosphoribosyltransferase family protein [Candidatus Roizmanbacteria bacterium]|nr:phosphoribosyltransferase family protein [Candidatus Roizmanbacteria bacterium]
MDDKQIEEKTIAILKKVGAVITDSHFVYTSGKHGSVYVNKDAVYPHTAETSRIGELFAEKYKDQDIDVVVGPALGGIILSTWIAYHLSELKGKEVLGVYTEKDANKNQVFTRNYDKLVIGKKVLVIEDLTTTGGSVKKVVDTVKQAGGIVVSVCVMVNRNPEGVNSEVMGAPFEALGVLPATAYDEAECPFCKEGRPVNTNVGHGKKYMEARSAAQVPSTSGTQ